MSSTDHGEIRLGIASAKARSELRLFHRALKRSFPRINAGAATSNLDTFDFQPSPFDKLRAGSAGLEPEPAVLMQTLLSFRSLIDEHPIIRLQIYSLTVQINCIYGIM
jgi:hypothetical protein